MALQRVKAVQDENSDWYVIPEGMLPEFIMLDEMIGSENFAESLNADDKFTHLFSKYKTGGDLNNTQLYADLNEN